MAGRVDPFSIRLSAYGAERMRQARLVRFLIGAEAEEEMAYLIAQESFNGVAPCVDWAAVSAGLAEFWEWREEQEARARERQAREARQLPLF